MRSCFVAVLAVISSAAAVPTAVVTAHQTTLALSLLDATDYYLFNLTIDQFMTTRKIEDRRPLGLNWTSNGCSSAPDDPFGFDCMSCSYFSYTFADNCSSQSSKHVHGMTSATAITSYKGAAIRRINDSSMRISGTI